MFLVHVSFLLNNNNNYKLYYTKQLKVKPADVSFRLNVLRIIAAQQVHSLVQIDLFMNKIKNRNI